MATLVSPGVSVTITDESFFIPAAAPTVPLIFIATGEEKTQSPTSLFNAAGTFESNIVRTVTSLRQSIELYGLPSFLEDSGGNPHHGDARNEYGLFALNQFLGIGSFAYVIRANVNLNDNIDDLQAFWDRKLLEASQVLENLTANFIDEFNTANGFIPSSPGFKQTVTQVEFLSLVAESMAPVFALFSFAGTETNFMGDHTTLPLNVFANGYTSPATGVFLGMTGIAIDWVNNLFGTVVPGEWDPTEAGSTLLAAGDDYKFTQEFLNETQLGANDAARRVAIVTALQASIVGNTEIRSEFFEFNLILAPGYFEVMDELVALSVDVKEEALVIGDTPVDRSPDGITNPLTGWAATTARQRSIHIAYYYPWGLGTNLDGKNVVIAPSGIALRTYAFNDDVAFLWFAPAGVRRGIITGISGLGYVTGQLGGPTVFVEVNLNQGQRDTLYQYAASGDLNPLVFFPGRGFLVWGQKTSAPAASALDRVNVSRLVKYLKRQIRKNVLPFVFEPNDQLTRDNMKAVIDNFLGDIVVKRGLFDFASICDESNNTPDRIDRNEMYCDIAIKPTRAAEFIYIPIRVVSTGAEI